jgi:hypothetical protein
MTEHSDIRASATSDVMPTNECDLDISCGTEQAEIRKFSDLKTEVECEHLFCIVGERMHFFAYCPKCGVKL